VNSSCNGWKKKEGLLALYKSLTSHSESLASAGQHGQYKVLVNTLGRSVKFKVHLKGNICNITNLAITRCSKLVFFIQKCSLQ
jgi:hypothetical protein